MFRNYTEVSPTYREKRIESPESENDVALPANNEEAVLEESVKTEGGKCRNSLRSLSQIHGMLIQHRGSQLVASPSWMLSLCAR